RQQRETHYTPMDGVEEDVLTEWSENAIANNDEEGWEDEEEFGRKSDYRRQAAEGLREYRREY
ncbi:MAG TPA: hypothetical protein VKI62_04610, partial [Bacteroidota bacterium]|nr:hypothetical protein [Bacteroidota bacterium]